MVREPQMFKVRCEFENDADGRPGHEPMTIAVSRNSMIRTADDAVAHIMGVVGEMNGKKVTRIHHRDETIGEYFSVVKATKVRDEPFNVSEAPVLQSIADAPPPESK